MNEQVLFPTGRQMDPRHLIDDIDARQNDLLARLADLNSRVESLVNEWLATRDQSKPDTETETARRISAPPCAK